MRNILLILMLSIGFYSIAQKYEPSKGAMENSFIVEVPGLSKDDIYKNLEEYITVTYVDKDAVVRGSINGDFIRFTGVERNVVFQCGWCVKFSLKYTVSIDVKDDKIRINYESIGHPDGGNWNRYFFKKDGSLRKNKTTRKSYYSLVSILQEMLTNLSEAANGNKDRGDNW